MTRRWATSFLLAVAAGVGCSLTNGLGFVCDEQFHCAAPLVCDSTRHCAANCATGESAVNGICSADVDAGNPDAGSDGGHPDAGRGDAGLPDAGTIDGGGVDAGTSDSGPEDAGMTDGGSSDAGRPDGGLEDAGPTDAGGRSDAGSQDAGLFDAGVHDGGLVDAGPVDAGPLDAGLRDAGPPDAGPRDAGSPDSGFACGGSICSCDGELACVSNQCVADTLWTQGPVTADTPADASYMVSTDQMTVTDLTTGLVWQRTSPNTPCPPAVAGVCALADAQTYCAGLSLGAYSSGWRVPNVVELMSIVSLSVPGGIVNTSAFPDMPGGYFWTSTPFVSATDSAWDVSFDDGTPSYDPVSNQHGVRCVH